MSNAVEQPQAGTVQAEIVKRFKENLARLMGCTGPHRFVRARQIVAPGRPPDNRMVCEKCRGFAEASEFAFYVMGLKHGKEHNGQPNRPVGDPGPGLAGAEDEHGPDG